MKFHSKIAAQYKKRLGASLENSDAHQCEHKNWSRRDFMRLTGLAGMGAGMSIAGTPLSAFTPSPMLAALASGDCGDRVLVMIRLKGGNDGMNMVILRGNDEYYNIRPTIAIQENELWGLSQEIGMPNTMLDLQPFWNDGKMQVIHNVGYPNQNYSHFRSSDIWASASGSRDVVNTGWIGRFLDNEYQAFLSAPPVVPPALEIGISSNMIFRSGSSNMALAISNPREFYQIAQTGQLFDTSSLSSSPRDLELAFTRQVANSAYRYSESIRDAYNSSSTQASYQDNYLSEQLAIVARLIKGNLGTKVYMVSIGGFDTHADQSQYHPNLMNALATGIRAFYDDLAASGVSQNVLSFTFSEFGRTIFENGSNGTDHGTGAPMLVFGEGIGPKFHGTPPDLLDLNRYGDPEYSVDFRNVYASVMQDWLCQDPSVSGFVLGNEIDKITGLLPESNPPLGANGDEALLGHAQSLEKPGVIEIKYALSRRGTVRLQILDKSGYPLRTLLYGFKDKGSHIFEFKPSEWFLPSGRYNYKLDTGGKVYARPIQW
ncbi:MAG: DUF1501 domain-containing protein [Saprospiraceae bacterium]|nr:DUF1501 domain-containing protein [Saprospiraceae bacterium]